MPAEAKRPALASLELFRPPRGAQDVEMPRVVAKATPAGAPSVPACPAAQWGRPETQPGRGDLAFAAHTRPASRRDVVSHLITTRRGGKNDAVRFNRQSAPARSADPVGQHPTRPPPRRAGRPCTRSRTALPQRSSLAPREETVSARLGVLRLSKSVGWKAYQTLACLA